MKPRRARSLPEGGAVGEVRFVFRPFPIAFLFLKLFRPPPFPDLSRCEDPSVGVLILRLVVVRIAELQFRKGPCFAAERCRVKKSLFGASAARFRWPLTTAAGRRRFAERTFSPYAGRSSRPQGSGRHYGMTNR